jgi:hypothetical protein
MNLFQCDKCKRVSFTYNHQGGQSCCGQSMRWVAQDIEGGAVFVKGSQQ